MSGAIASDLRLVAEDRIHDDIDSTYITTVCLQMGFAPEGSVMTRRVPHGENRLSDTNRDWQLLADCCLSRQAENGQ